MFKGELKQMNPIILMVWIVYVAGIVNGSHAKYVRDSAREDFGVKVVKIVRVKKVKITLDKKVCRGYKISNLLNCE